MRAKPALQLLQWEWHRHGIWQIFYTSKESLKLFCENWSLNSSYFIDRVFFREISWKFYPSPKIFYTSATCDKCHFCNDNDNDNENANNLDLSQGHWHGNQAEPEVGQWEIEDEKVPEKVVFNIESGGKKSQLSCASEQMRPWMEKWMPGISEPRKKKNC